MPRAKTKTKTDDLARIRNNQRRSRAKRLEYIRELEDKARKYEELSTSPDQPSREDFKKLQTENAWMRGLLATLDINFNPLDAPPGSILDNDPSISTSIMYPSAGDFIAENLASNTVPAPSASTEDWNTLALMSNTGDLMGLDLDSFSIFNESSLPCRNPVSAQSNFEGDHCQEPERLPSKGPTNENTTLCSLACQWVIQCNTKGVELDVLYFRMERGFKAGNSPLDGCRVDNQVLLSVLTEIS